jgi:hypothetical protein
MRTVLCLSLCALVQQAGCFHTRIQKCRWRTGRTHVHRRELLRWWLLSTLSAAASGTKPNPSVQEAYDGFAKRYDVTNDGFLADAFGIKVRTEIRTRDVKREPSEPSSNSTGHVFWGRAGNRCRDWD